METSKGEAFLEFQKYCKELRKLGVLLAIDSKNDESNALLGLEHPEGVMRYDDFVSIKVNWEQKDINLSNIAEDLEKTNQYKARAKFVAEIDLYKNYSDFLCSLKCAVKR